MPLQATSGAASYDAFGGGVAAVPNYIEDVFSDYLFSGTSASNTINNGVDASGKGALVWIKDRGAASTPHMLFDTTRGVGKYIQSNSTGSQGNIADTLTAFNSNGFTLGADSFGVCNALGHNYVSWMFREAPKFFDVVTYTGNGGTQQNIPHNLGSSPNCIIVKRTDAAGDWYVAPMMLSNWNNDYLVLNSTAAKVSSSDIWQGTSSKSSTTFGVLDGSTVNISGATYVAYLFAHNAGGFGLTGTDNVISCGSYTGTGSVGPSVNLGYEPQWLLIKRATGTSAISGWYLLDNMRGIPLSGGSNYLRADTSDAETNNSYAYATPTATGFNVDPGGVGLTGVNFSGETYIYIAIRRGPMKVPTDGTSVFAPAYYASGLATGTKSVTNFPVDMQIARYPDFGSSNNWVADRLRGVSSNATASGPYLMTFSTNAETTNSSLGWDNTGFLRSPNLGTFDPQVYWNFRRAPNTHDEVCYTGTGSARTVAHNLTVAPELMIVKQRGGTTDWVAYVQPLGNTVLLAPNLNIAQLTFPNAWNNTSPTSTEFTVGISGVVNTNGGTYVAYLFATCAGVSKVGTFTGNGSTQAIACGFTGGSRFVLIKATSTTGNWICVDTARGMTTSSNPVLYLNSNAAETATSGACITSTGGFTVDESKLTGVNTSGVSYIFLSYA